MVVICWAVRCIAMTRRTTRCSSSFRTRFPIWRPEPQARRVSIIRRQRTAARHRQCARRRGVIRRSTPPRTSTLNGTAGEFDLKSASPRRQGWAHLPYEPPPPQPAAHDHLQSAGMCPAAMISSRWRLNPRLTRGATDENQPEILTRPSSRPTPPSTRSACAMRPGERKGRRTAPMRAAMAGSLATWR